MRSEGKGERAIVSNSNAGITGSSTKDRGETWGQCQGLSTEMQLRMLQCTGIAAYSTS